MKRLAATVALTLSALAMTACVTIIDANSSYGWTGSGSQAFDGARDACREQAGQDEGTTAFITCMAEKGWSRTRD